MDTIDVVVMAILSHQDASQRASCRIYFCCHWNALIRRHGAKNQKYIPVLLQMIFYETVSAKNCRTSSLNCESQKYEVFKRLCQTFPPFFIRYNATIALTPRLQAEFAFSSNYKVSGYSVACLFRQPIRHSADRRSGVIPTAVSDDADWSFDVVAR